MEEELNPLGSLPTINDLPYYSSGDAELLAKGYDSVPTSNIPQLDLYKPSYSSNTDNFVNALRADTLSNLSSPTTDTLTSIINNTNNKINISGGYVKANDAYEKLSDGTLLPKYEMYKPGINNEAYNASMQSGTEKFFNPIKRGITKVGRGIFADIGSFVYGIGEAAVTGRAESIFDNSMSNYVDDLDKKTDFAYKNYYTEAQNGLGANLYTWDKVLGGAEFTARMLGAEAAIAVATGGASLPSNFARIGARLGLSATNAGSRLARATRALRGAEALEDVLEVGARASRVTGLATEPLVNVARQGGGIFSADRYARGIQSAINAGKLADNLKQARFAVTGSMYEAGFEARHYQTEAENAFWEYHRANGTEPTQKEVGDFYNKLDNTTWSVFGANMGILSVSNMALFGNMLNIKNPFPKLSTGAFFDKSVFRIGTKQAADNIWRPLKAGFFNKALAYSAPIVKGAFVEGVFEEGGQGIASGMMKNYMASTYDPKAMKETSDYASAFTKAFKDQYSTKEGLEEVVIGGIIGGLFGGVGGIREINANYRNQEFVAQVQNAMPQVADNIVTNLYTNENLSNIFGHSNRLQTITERIESARERGDVTGTALHSAESFISMLQASSSVGKTDEFMKILKASLQGMDNAKIAEGQGISLEEVDNFKNEKIQGVERIAENYDKAREAAGYIFGRGNIGGFYEVEGKKVNRQNLIDAFAYTSAMGGVSQQIAGDSFNAFQQKLAETGTSREITEQFGTLAALQSAGQLELTRYTQASQDEVRLSRQRKKIEDDILRNQKNEPSPENTEKLEKLAQDLIDVGNELTQASQNKDLYWKSIADNFYKNLGSEVTGFLPQADFDNFNTQTKDLQSFLNRSSLTEFDKLELNKLLEEYNKANEAFKSFNNLAQALSTPKFTFKTYNNIFSGIRAKSDQSLNDLTKQTLLDLYNTDTKVVQTLTEAQPTPSLVTDEVMAELSNSEYQLPSEIVNFIVDKVKNNKTLSENEKTVYNQFKNIIDEVNTTSQVDPINEESPRTEVTSQTAKITNRRNEFKKLRNGEITPSIQNEINRIDAEIDNLINNPTNNLITNLDEILEAGFGRIEVRNREGEKVDFDTFDIVIDSEDNTAQVGYVKKTKRTENKGIAYDAYVELGTRLAERGIKLTSPKGNKLTGGIELWNRLVREGYAVNTSQGFEFKTNTNERSLLDRLKELNLTDESAYNEAQKIIDSIDFSDENSITEGISRLANQVAGKNISETKSSPENYVRGKEKLIGNDNYRTKEYLESYINIVYRDFSNNEDFFNKPETTQQEQAPNVSNLSEIQTLENSKNSLIQDRISELEEEISDLKSQESLDKQVERKRKTLTTKISNLKNEILNDIAREGGVVSEEDLKLKDIIKKPYYTKVRKLRKWEGQLRDLNRVREEFDPSATYREQLEWVLDNSNILEYENVESLSQVSPPPQKDVERYLELDAKKRKTKTEKDEFASLRENLLPYSLVEGSFFGGIPLIDIINVYNQTLDQQTLEDNQIERLSEPELQTAIKVVQDQETTPEFRSPEVGLVYDGVYLKGGTGVQGIHHIKLSTILNAGLFGLMDMSVTEFTEDENGVVTYSDPQPINESNIDEIARKYDNFQGVKIEIGNDLALEKSVRGTNFVVEGDLTDLLGLIPYAITGQPNSYNLLYEEKSDGTLSPKQSEFEVTRDGIQVPFDKETLNSLKLGDEVTLFYDPNDDYNKTLKKKDLLTKANIYIMKNGNLVNILKALPNYKSQGEGWEQLSNLRKEVIENGTSTIKIKNSYMGLPNITIGTDGKALELSIDETMVESYGYIDNEGNYKFFNKTNPTNTQYTDPYLELGKVVPIVSFNYNGKTYTFPIQIESASKDATPELDAILNNQNLNEYQKIFQINNLLNKYGLLTESLRLTNQNDTLDAIRDSLTSVGGRTDITNEEQFKNANKTIVLNMADPFMSAKLVLDLKSTSQILEELPDNTDEKIEPSTNIGEDLSNENKC